jgi:hypothetical protein
VNLCTQEFFSLTRSRLKEGESRPLYCLNRSVEKAETLVADNAASIKKDWFVDWLWEKLQTDFGFQLPENRE